MKAELEILSPIDQENDIFYERRLNQKLVEKARKGDQEAFSELVRIHRAKAQGWAYSVTKDSFLAEDIVQEALFRAFLKLGTLLETDKFTPWLRQIVRNQALMSIRSSKPIKQEQPFTTIESSKYPSPSEIDWRDIDQILFYLSYTASEKTKQANPEEHLLRLSVLEGIHSLLYCLSFRERKIFEAYFFDNLNPMEISNLFDTTKANVYNTISRSRKKVQKERIRLCIQEHVQKRANLGFAKRKILSKPVI